VYFQLFIAEYFFKKYCLFFRPTSPDLDAAVALSSRQLEELMDDDCPVSTCDPMLSSPHLSPCYYGGGVTSSPASSIYSDQALSPSGGHTDSMDLSGPA
jgi:hypothetical protein